VLSSWELCLKDLGNISLCWELGQVKRMLKRWWFFLKVGCCSAGHEGDCKVQRGQEGNLET